MLETLLIVAIVIGVIAILQHWQSTRFENSLKAHRGDSERRFHAIEDRSADIENALAGVEMALDTTKIKEEVDSKLDSFHDEVFSVKSALEALGQSKKSQKKTKKKPTKKKR